jgi:hypothetical protein
MKRMPISPLLAIALVAASAHGSATERAAAARITPAEISGHIRFLADDLLEGRKPGTRGADLAVKYIAAEMESMGLVPGATAQDGSPSWYQPVPLVELPCACRARWSSRVRAARCRSPRAWG